MDSTFERKSKGTEETLFGSVNFCGKDEWLTPKAIVDSLGKFDLDPCSPIDRPWATADRHFTILDDGLKKQWSGRVWCNPPYGNKTGTWIKRCKDHGNAIALIFARTETSMFFESIWDDAHAIFFFKGRLKFYHANGREAKSSAGAPSMLVAYGQDNIASLLNSGIAGKTVILK